MYPKGKNYFYYYKIIVAWLIFHTKHAELYCKTIATSFIVMLRP